MIQRLKTVKDAHEAELQAATTALQAEANRRVADVDNQVRVFWSAST
jgi:hypothetical protein